MLQIYMKIVRWWFLCALDADCIAPTKDLFCKFATGPNRFAYYANCHRYDQSALNVLVVNHFIKQLSSNDTNSVKSLYAANGALKVLRGERHNEPLQLCANDRKPRESSSTVLVNDYFPHGMTA
jgi:hypothetical protein